MKFSMVLGRFDTARQIYNVDDVPEHQFFLLVAKEPFGNGCLKC